MNESEHTEVPLDPKEAMRQALERKKEKEHPSVAHGVTAERDRGQTHGPASAQREFRRKSG